MFIIYIDGETTEEELEDMSVACAEIIAHCSSGLLREFYKIGLPEASFREIF